MDTKLTLAGVARVGLAKMKETLIFDHFGVPPLLPSSHRQQLDTFITILLPTLTNGEVVTPTRCRDRTRR